ncbi:unnamed protein product [Effrenium voratum]|nr:unnamed protein product [Effrenium voratum]
MPEAATDIVRKGHLKPATDIVKLDSDITRPTVKEISTNYVWLRGACEQFADKVPSAYMMADCMIMLDSYLCGGLLVPDKSNSKLTLAGREGRRMKKLMGALRYLYRNSFLVKSNMWSFAHLFHPRQREHGRAGL